MKSFNIFMKTVSYLVGDAFRFFETFFAIATGVIFLAIAWSFGSSKGGYFFAVLGAICLFMSAHIFKQKRNNYEKNRP
jgi:hypothetical protein